MFYWLAIKKESIFLGYTPFCGQIKAKLDIQGGNAMHPFQNKKILMFLFVVIFIAQIPAAFSFAEKYVTKKMTNNDVSDSSPSLYNGRIAWTRNDSGENQAHNIYYWNGTSATKITADPYYSGGPSLYNGTITWQEHTIGTGDRDLYYWNGTTTTNITNNHASNAQYTSLYDGTVAWLGWEDGDPEVYYWNGTSTTKITNNTAYDFVPSLYNNTITWYGNEDGDYEIYYWNGTSSPSTLIYRIKPF